MCGRAACAHASRERAVQEHASRSSLALAVIAPVEMGVFAAGHAGRLVERELLFALPPLFVGFGVWLDRGGPRPRLRTLGVVAAASPRCSRFRSGVSCRPRSSPTTRASCRSPISTARRSTGSLRCCARCRRASARAAARRLWLLPALLGGVFVAVSVSASGEFVDRSQAARAAYVASTTRLDRPRGGRYREILYDGGPDWQLIWTQLSLERAHVTGAIDLPTAHVPGPLPQRQLQILGNDGALRLVDGAFLGRDFSPRRRGSSSPGTGSSRRKPTGLSLWQLDAADARSHLGCRGSSRTVIYARAAAWRRSMSSTAPAARSTSLRSGATTRRCGCRKTAIR